MNIFHLLARTATRFPEHPALCHGEAVIATWADLHRRALGLAAAIAGEEPGARIAIASKNQPDYVTALFAIWAAGHVAVPVNAKLHPKEMMAIIADAGAQRIFALAELAHDLIAVGLPAAATVVIGSPAFEAMCAGARAKVADRAPDDLAWLFFTSGTTGRSKGAMLSHRNLLAMTISHLADFEDIREDWGIIHTAPMSHGSGLYILPYVARGGRQIVPVSGGFEPPEFLSLCAHHRGIGAFLAPTMLQRLRNALPQPGPDTAIAAPGLRNVIYGGGPMYLEDIRKSLAAFGPIFCQLYGQGECPMTITGLRPRDFAGAGDDVLASVGWARAGIEVQVVGDDGQPLAPGEVGEIRCRGDIVMAGYWNDPDATRATLRDGWLATGDTGFLADNGMLTLRDRTKDVIISGGTNIYPREVEEALLTCPGVGEVSVIGEIDEEWGESVVAFIVRDADGGDLDAARLDAHCLDRIARFKRPKRYIFAESLPKSAYGKVLKRELVALLAP